MWDGVAFYHPGNHCVQYILEGVARQYDVSAQFLTDEAVCQVLHVLT